MLDELIEGDNDFLEGGLALFGALGESPSGTKFAHKKVHYHTVNIRSLSHMGLNRYRVVTDGQTDGQRW